MKPKSPATQHTTLSCIRITGNSQPQYSNRPGAAGPGKCCGSFCGSARDDQSECEGNRQGLQERCESKVFGHGYNRLGWRHRQLHHLRELSELTANITVADTAVIANFDIQVANTDGRGGKGTELFAVVAKGGRIARVRQ